MIENYNAFKQKQQDEEAGWGKDTAGDTGGNASGARDHDGVMARLAELEATVQTLRDRNAAMDREIKRLQTQLQVGFVDLNARVSALETHVFTLNWGGYNR